MAEILKHNVDEVVANEGSRKSVPVTIVTGFLGSGKTTLLNYILTAKHGKRIAVIENEFGDEIGVESLIAKDGANGEWFDEFFSLGNGCICCSVKDDLVNTLERLLERKDKFDYILIETTGMANPGPLASTFWLDEELESQMHLDGVITIVDSKNILRRISEKAKKSGKACNEATLQIAYADILMMNKLDLVPKASDVENVVREIRQINSIASIYKTVKSQIDLDLILNVKAFHAKKVKEHALTDHSDHSHPHDHSTHEHSTANSDGSNTHSHSNHCNVKTVTLVSKVPVDLSTFNQWLGETIWVEPEDDSDEEMLGEPTSEGHGLSTSSPSGSEPESIVSKRVPQIFRMKGIVSVSNDDKKYILQAVNDLFECEPLQDEKEGFWGKDEERVTRVVVIGRFLDSLKPYNASFSVLKKA